ncbi:MAG: hypothetical protein H7Z42_23155 [Roseiflexaceae bacterium]|nr:hypothetical protein [Roseiflexaceae bacterium]
MPVRLLADISGPFYNPDQPPRNWSSFPFAQFDLAQEPYVDTAALAAAIARASAHVHALRAQGYTGIVIDNLAHLTSFDDAPQQVYSRHSPFRSRALAYQSAFEQLFGEAAALGMEVFVTADLQWATPPVRAFVGPLDARNPRLAELNSWALAELFDRFPQVRGLVVRVGEVGGAHDLGEAYTGSLIYRDAASLRCLIAALLPACVARDRLLIVRTWSVGIGALGDMVWNAARYREIFSGLESSHLIASIKHGPGDFFRNAAHNPTLGLPGPRQWVELQSRREYELFGMIPASVARLHQQALAHAHANPQLDGVWVWNATGGWGGGRAALGPGGWNLWTELSSALTAMLVSDPGLDTSAFIRTWCAQRLDPVFGQAVADLYLDSERLIEDAWYPAAGEGAGQIVGKIMVPPLLWVWWLRPTASLLVWSMLALAEQGRASTTPESAAAVVCARAHARRLVLLAPRPDPAFSMIIQSARYLADTLAVAHIIRAYFGALFATAAADNRLGWLACARAARRTRLLLATHTASWTSNADFPRLELGEIDAFLRELERAPQFWWRMARVAVAVCRRLETAAPAPQRGPVLALALRQAALLLPLLNRRLYLLPSVIFETGPGAKAWAA